MKVESTGSNKQMETNMELLYQLKAAIIDVWVVSLST